MKLSTLAPLLLACNTLALPQMFPPLHHGQWCTPRHQAVRKEWGSLTLPERTNYINAVKCLKEKPSCLDPTVVPGAKSRYDDFLAIHINQTLAIHASGIFLAWHRNFLWLWEKALQEECGYQGNQPYWNWALYCTDLEHSPIFDGSPTSLGGNGVYNATQGPYQVGNGTLPHGSGGGCQFGGPFGNMTVNMGPFDFLLAFAPKVPDTWPLYTPHCLIRDLNNYISTKFGSQQVVDALLSQPDIAAFQQYMSGTPPTIDTVGPHGGGHFAIGLGLQDFFASPGDPAFYLHHGQVDRMWTFWQDADGKTRRNAINGTSTIWYAPTTPEVTLDTVLNWGILGKEKTMRELMSPAEGDFCYRYE